MATKWLSCQIFYLKDHSHAANQQKIFCLKLCFVFAGQVLLKLCDRSSLLSVVSHSLSAYITTLEPVPLQR